MHYADFISKVIFNLLQCRTAMTSFMNLFPGRNPHSLVYNVYASIFNGSVRFYLDQDLHHILISATLREIFRHKAKVMQFSVGMTKSINRCWSTVLILQKFSPKVSDTKM